MNGCADLRILVADDNEHFRQLVATLLGTQGLTRVEHAHDGTAALSLLQEVPIDLAVLDLQMRPMDGLRLLRVIRDEATSPCPRLPVLMVSGYTEPGLVAAVRQAGANEYLAKPITAKSFLRCVLRMVEYPRAFVRSETYFGPDRRRRQLALRGPERRCAPPTLIPVSRLYGDEEDPA